MKTIGISSGTGCLKTKTISPDTVAGSLQMLKAYFAGYDFGLCLNLCSPRAFLSLKMPEVADIEPLPVAQARAGEPAAWDALFRRFQLPLYVFVFELIRDEQASLDVVQETFIAAAKHLGSLREDGKFGSWLFGIAHQKVIQRWRKRTEVLLDEIPETPDELEAGPDDVLIRREQEKEFMKLLEQLPSPHRAVLLLHFIEEFSLEEIGRITETNLGTVKSRLHYAKKALRKLVEAKDENAT
jgi:RNA polymerase sigma-70 factor (ECF subfamily)